MLLLKEVYDTVVKKGYIIGNIDTVVVAQKPKLQPYIHDIRQSLAATLDCDIDHISVKATTSEKLGFEGRQEGISTHAVVLLMPHS